MLATQPGCLSLLLAVVSTTWALPISGTELSDLGHGVRLPTSSIRRPINPEWIDKEIRPPVASHDEFALPRNKPAKGVTSAEAERIRQRKITAKLAKDSPSQGTPGILLHDSPETQRIAARPIRPGGATQLKKNGQAPSADAADALKPMRAEIGEAPEPRWRTAKTISQADAAELQAYRRPMTEGESQFQ